MAASPTPRERVLADLERFQQTPLLSLLADEQSPQAARLWDQLLHFSAWYKGGVGAYLSSGTRLYRELLGLPADELQDGEGDAAASWIPSNPSADSSPTVAALESPEFAQLEALGLENVDKLALVIVAGGLGERLGYQGIKLQLPVETLTRTAYLEAYVQHVRALEAQFARRHPGQQTQVPIAIMTSDSTHAATVAFLQQREGFGLPEGQLTLIKQERVPCLDVLPGSEGEQVPRLQLVVKDGELALKPHGHGDVHSLLHSSGLAKRWAAEGKQFVHFIQDTNFPILNSVLPLLGASLRHRWAFTFTTVARKAKDASGGIVRFSDPQDPSRSALFNVEYHELDQFLKTRAKDEFPDGDVNDPATGFSPFPGNINHMAVALDPYVHVLETTHGFVPEVFNPKFAAGSNMRAFKSPARTECMMQDYPKLLVQVAATEPDVNVSMGFVVFPTALVYSPCKNDAASASAKTKDDIPPQCAASAEHDVFAINRQKLRAVGVTFPDAKPVTTEWLGIPVDTTGPQLVFTGGFAPAQSVLAANFPTPEAIKISRRSTVILDGQDIMVHALDVDGAVKISAVPGAQVEVKSLHVENAGVEYEPVDPADASAVDAMRGYRLKQVAVKEFRFDTPGSYTIEQ